MKVQTGFEYVNLKTATSEKESFMRKIKLLGVVSQLQDIQDLLKKKQIDIALDFVVAAIDYIDINKELTA